jgi:predicted nicotinamide N-methyase
VLVRGEKPSISKEDVDVIICSDCIYDEDLVEILAKTIAALARPDTGAHLCVFSPHNAHPRHL